MTKISVGLSTNLLEPKYMRLGLDGIGVYTSVLLDGLPKHGCEVQPWSYPVASSDKNAAVGNALPSPHMASLLRDVAMPLWRTQLPVDIFHATDYRINRMSCPVVATLHDAIPMKFPEWYDGWVRKVKNHFLRKTAGFADHVIALSHFSIAELVECFGVDEKRVSVVHCGVASTWLERLPSDQVDRTLDKHGLRPGYFLFVGTLQPRKNVERILDAYLKLPAQVKKERQLVIVGRAGWRCDDVLAKLKVAKENGENVVWLNYVSGEESLRQLYAGAGVFVFPSLHEGFGIPVVEAFASNVPVVTSNTTSLPEVSLGAALEVNPLSVSEIGTAMLDLATNDALRQRCMTAGRERAEQLTWDRTVEKTAEVYRAVLGR